MKHVRIGLGMAVLAVFLCVGTAYADDPVMTKCKVTKATAAGTGPYTITAEGSVSLSANEKMFAGVQYSVLELVEGGAKYSGFTNLPDGPPVPGMAAKKVTGSSPPLPRKGEYQVEITMQYLNNVGALKTIAGVTNVKVE